MMRSLAVVGNVNVDLILGPTEAWPRPGTEVLVAHDEMRVGGAAGNTALAWSGAGVPFAVAGNVGRDALGTWLSSAFGERAARWPMAPARTTISVGLTHPDDERTFFTTVGHLPHLTLADVLAQLDGQGLGGGLLLVCGCFVLEGLADDLGALFDWADARGIDVALDPGWPVRGWTEAERRRATTWVRRTRHLLVNEIEAMGLTATATVEDALAALEALMPKGGVAVIKTGPRGAVALGPGGVANAEAPRVTVIDTIGAGDVFNAGYLAAVAQGAPTGAALRAGVAMASLAISTSPRCHVLPALDEVVS